VGLYAFQEGLLDPVQQRLRALGVEPEGKTSMAFTAFQRSEVSKWGKFIQAAGVVPE
jgi:tripartite-type tricarboxylate transporter receptor subunit TctC